MRRRTLTGTITTTVAVLALGTAMSAPAGAATGQDCVLDATTGTTHCFGDFRRAVAWATSGAITDAPTDAREAATSASFTARVAALSAAASSRTSGGTTADAVLTSGGTGTTTAVVQQRAALADSGSSVIGATLFEGAGYTGYSLTVRIAAPCEDDGEYDYELVLPEAARSTESLQTWGNCWAWLHEGTTTDSYRQGPYKVDTPDLGDWANRAQLLGLS